MERAGSQQRDELLQDPGLKSPQPQEGSSQRRKIGPAGPHDGGPVTRVGTRIYWRRRTAKGFSSYTARGSSGHTGDRCPCEPRVPAVGAFYKAGGHKVPDRLVQSV